jgi:bifunctional non-homologous end joining protein LigD
MSELPEFIRPMLAKPGEAFDSDEHLFEVKWDGTRAVAFVESDGYRLVNRRQNDITERYPEFAFLNNLPAGTVLDGEVVVLDDQGRADFPALQVREQARSPLKCRTLSQSAPATYIVFDQLYHEYQSLMAFSLEERRESLQDTVTRCQQAALVASEGVIGPGTKFYEQAVLRDLEGVMAKRLASRYLPGKRSDAWIKIKKRSSVLCAIIGYVPKGDDFESLILASDAQGELRYVGKVGNGFDGSARDKMNQILRARHQKKPLVRCKEKGAWVQPGLYCQVRFLEWTRSGDLRDPVFEKLVES